MKNVGYFRYSKNLAYHKPLMDSLVTKRRNLVLSDSSWGRRDGESNEGFHHSKMLFLETLPCRVGRSNSCYIGCITIPCVLVRDF